LDVSGVHSVHGKLLWQAVKPFVFFG